MPMPINPDILHLEATNFVDKPTGGQLNFSRQLIEVMGNRIALVGWASTPSEPVGCWYVKKINGTDFRYFAIGRERLSACKPLLPARFITWLQVKRYQRRIFSIGIPNVIVREHSILMAIELREGYNLCYYFPGVESQLTISRYAWARLFARLFDYTFFRSLGLKASCILAAADQHAIDEVTKNARGKLRGKTVFQFSTRVNTDIYHPADPLLTRRSLGLPADSIIAVTTGRIHWAKGWQFLLESFKYFLDRIPHALLIFIGDGADRDKLERQIVVLGLQKYVIVAGYQSPPEIAAYLQASNLFVMGSFKEGWSTVLLEALACHVPIVTTHFSSADTIVRHGVNGFVVERDALLFSNAMMKALKLQDVSNYSNSVISSYSLKNLANDLFKVWSLI